MKWTPFWFEGNQWFKMVNGPEDWAKLMAAHAKVGVSVDRLMRVRECVRGPMDKDLPPKFGFASECCDKRTLGEFFKENGMPGVIIVRDEKEVMGL